MSNAQRTMAGKIAVAVPRVQLGGREPEEDERETSACEQRVEPATPGSPLNGVAPSPQQTTSVSLSTLARLGSRAKRGDGWNFSGVISAIPPRQTEWQRYGQIYPCGAVIAATQVWRASGYDIDFTGVGGQPTGFDQLMALYQNYIVTKIKYRCRGANVSSTIVNFNAMWFSAQSGGPASIAAVLGQMNSSLGGQNGTGSPQSTQQGELDIVKAYGCTLKEYRENPNFWGTASSDPANVMYLHMYTTAADLATALTGVYHCVEIELLFEFFNPVQLPAS